VTVSAPKRSRNRTVRTKRVRGLSQRGLAQIMGLSRWRIRQILEETGGDPIRDQRLATMSETELMREQARLVDRIASDARRLMVVEEELVVRGTDRLLGLT
jgi:hypothetical protein